MQSFSNRIGRPKADEPSRTVQENVARWVRRLSFLRGVLAAISMLTFLSTLFGWPTWEIARFVHATLIQWKTFASWIGGLFGLIPFLPKLSADVVNYLVLLSTVTVPGLYGFFKSTFEPGSMGPDVDPRVRKMTNWVGIVAMAMLCIPAGYIFLELLKGPEHLNPHWDSIPGVSPQIVLMQYYLFAAFGSVIPFIFSMTALKSYRNGVIFVAGALAVCELVYFAPVIGDRMKAFSDQTLGTPMLD